MQARRLLTVLFSFVLVASVVSVSPVQSAVTIDPEGPQSFNIGASIKTSMEAVENGASNGSHSQDFLLDDMWLLTSGTLVGEHGALDSVGFTFNTEIDGSSNGNDLHLLDANLKFDFASHSKLRFGRILTPISRSNMSGPFFTGTWYFPTVLEVGSYPVAWGGRDDGVAYWGTVLEDSLKYQISATEGFGTSAGQQSDKFLYTGRVTFNALDPEPGYYNASTYYGSKDILAFSAAYQTESDAFGTGQDYSALTLETLYEVPLANGHVPTLELSYQDYDKSGNGASSGTFATTDEGSGYFALVGYKAGSFRPHVRYQVFDDEQFSSDVERIDAGVDYLLSGHNGKITATYTDNFNNEVSSAEQDAAFNLGMQFQI